MNVEKMTIEQAKNIMLDLRKAYASGNFNSELENAVKIDAKLLDEFHKKRLKNRVSRRQKTLTAILNVFFNGFVSIFGTSYYVNKILIMMNELRPPNKA